MHAVDQSWASNHQNGSGSLCRVCHGSDYRGTALSWALADRTFGAMGTKHFWRGFQIGCYNCHAGPNSENSNGNIAAAVSNLSAATAAEAPVPIPLQAADADGNLVTVRIVSQPAHGTVNLSGNMATYYPSPGFVGIDSFTYAAWDGSTDSNLGTVDVTVTSGNCALTASTFVPTAAFPDSPVPFRATAPLSRCVGPIVYDWDFGDGSPHSSETNVCHIYTEAGDYNWALTVNANGTSQTVNGMLTVSPTLGPPLVLSIRTLDPYTTLLSWPYDRIPTSLEISSDMNRSSSWMFYWEAPVLDSKNLTVQMDLLPGQQFFRLRRVP
jgi:hypothetical protein